MTLVTSVAHVRNRVIRGTPSLFQAGSSPPVITRARLERVTCGFRFRVPPEDGSHRIGAMGADAYVAPSSFHGRDTEVRIVAVAPVACPEADHAAILLAKLAHFERGRARTAYVDLDGSVFDDDAKGHPVGGNNRGIHRVFELLGKFLSKARPVVFRYRYVLNRVLAPARIGDAKVEGTQIDGLVSVVILSVECHTNEALVRHVAAANVELDRALPEINAVDPHDARSRLFRYVHTVALLAPGDLAIHGLQFSGRQPLDDIDCLRRTALHRPPGPNGRRLRGPRRHNRRAQHEWSSEEHPSDCKIHTPSGQSYQVASPHAAQRSDRDGPHATRGARRPRTQPRRVPLERL